MFGLIGHSSSFSEARLKARDLGFEDLADGELDIWCSAPPQLLETFEVTSNTGKTIQGTYIDSCFVPEMLSRFKTATRKVQNAMELAQKRGINITALGGFTSIIFENFNLAKFQQIRSTLLQWERFTTGNTHTAWVICRQVEQNAPLMGIDLAKARVAVVGATGDIGSAVCRWLSRRSGVADLLLWPASSKGSTTCARSSAAVKFFPWRRHCLRLMWWCGLLLCPKPSRSIQPVCESLV